MTTQIEIVDHSALKFNQMGIIALALSGFILNQPILDGFVAVVLLLGTLMPEFALFKQTYVHVLKPLRLMKPDPVEDARAPHEFAQFLGGIVLLVGTLFLFTGWLRTGWVLTWVVILLAAANLFFGFCAGCFVYYQLGRLGMPGFHPRPRENEEHVRQS